MSLDENFIKKDSCNFNNSLLKPITVCCCFFERKLFLYIVLNNDNLPDLKGK